MNNVMIKAWEIARKGQEKFGGKVSEYFAQALKMAWALIKKGVAKVESKKDQYIELVKEFAALAQESKKYNSEVATVDTDHLINAYDENRSELFLNGMTQNVENGKAYLKQLQETIVRTNNFETVKRVLKATKDMVQGRKENADSEGYYILPVGFYEVVENGNVKYIQVSPNRNDYREVSKQNIIDWV